MCRLNNYSKYQPLEIEVEETNLYYACGITSNGVTSGVAYLHDLAPGQHSSEETSQRWRAVGGTVHDLTDPRFDPRTFLTDVLATALIRLSFSMS